MLEAHNVLNQKPKPLISMMHGNNFFYVGDKVKIRIDGELTPVKILRINSYFLMGETAVDLAVKLPSGHVKYLYKFNGDIVL